MSWNRPLATVDRTGATARCGRVNTINVERITGLEDVDVFSRRTMCVVQTIETHRYLVWERVFLLPFNTGVMFLNHVHSGFVVATSVLMRSELLS